jgi:hypothetical protein
MTTRTGTILTHLQSGETLYLPIDSGTTLLVVIGDVVLREPPRWLADTMVVRVMPLVAGQCHRVGHTGWIELKAGGNGAEVRSHQSLSIWQAAWKTFWSYTILTQRGF